MKSLLSASLAALMVVIPAYADDSFLLLGANNSSSSFLFPALGTTDFLGDSRVANGFGGAVLSAGTYATSSALVLGYPGWAMLASKNNWLAGKDSGRGIGSTTSLSLYDRIRSTIARNTTGQIGGLAPAITLNGYTLSITGGAVVGSGGSGYGASVSGTLTWNGSGCSVNPVLNVTTNSSGAISTLSSIATAGTCTSLPNGSSWTVGGSLSAGSNAIFALTSSAIAAVTWGAGTGGQFGGFPGYKTPGAINAPGWVRVTFDGIGADGCGAQRGYTVTDSASDANIPTGCIADTAAATSTYGGLYSTRRPPTSAANPPAGAYANFVLTQPASGTRAQTGDVIQFTTFGPQLPAFSATNTASNNPVDAEWDVTTFGTVTAINSPASAVMVIDSVNDGGAGVYSSPTAGTYYAECPGPDYPSYSSMPNVLPCLSMVDLAAVIDDYKGTGKVVFLADEAPAGISNVSMESHTVTAGATTITATQGATFKYDGNSFSGSATYLGQAVSNVPGLVGVVSGAFTVYTQVASAPAVGQYSVSGSGVYTINASDPLSTSGGTAYLTYAYGNGVSGNQQKIMHAWLSSKASDFVWGGAVTGCNGGVAPCDFHFPGALYNRPWVVSIPLFESLVDTRSGNSDMANDPGCVTHNCAAIPGAFDSIGPHPTVYGGAVSQAAFAAALASVPAYASLPDNTQPAQWSNLRYAQGNGASLTYTATLPPSFAYSGHPQPQLYYTYLSVLKGPYTYSGTNGTGAFPGAPDIASANLDLTGAGSSTITFVTGHPPTNGSYIYLIEDPTNVLENPLFITGNYGVDTGPAPCAGSSGITQMPYAWLCTVLGGTGLTITWSTGTDSNGYPTISATVTGVATGAGSVTISPITGNLANDQIVNGAFTRMSGQTARASVNAVISPYNGHVFGIYGPHLSMSASSPSFTEPNDYTVNGNTATLNAGTIRGAGAGSMSTAALFGMSDLVINGITGNSSGIAINLLTPIINWAGTPGTGAFTISFSINWVAGPVNGTVTFSRPTYRIRS